MKNKICSKASVRKTIHQLLAKGIIPVDIFYQGISSLESSVLLRVSSLVVEISSSHFFLQNVLDQVDEIDKKMEVLIAENQNAKEDRGKST